MVDRSPTPDPAGPDRDGAVPDDAAREREVPDAEADEAPAPSRSLMDRWWWQSFTVAVVGAVVIAFQWEAIGAGEGLAANWAMVGLGALAILVGGYLFVVDRRKQQGRDKT